MTNGAPDKPNAAPASNSPSSPSNPSSPESSRPPATPDNPQAPGDPNSPADTRAGKKIKVNLSTQTAKLLDGSTEVRTMKISSGRARSPTPTGNFNIEFRDRDHRSSTYGICVGSDGKKTKIRRSSRNQCPRGTRYEGTPMPFYQRFTDAKGFHQGPLPGHPDSHGCVRLGHDDAEFLWNWSQQGTPVHVFGQVPGKGTKKKGPTGRKH